MNQKTIRGLLMAVLLVLSFVIEPVAASAQTIGGVSYRLGASENRSNKSDENISLIDLSIPSDVWNISSSGRYNFSGSSNTVNVYTNYKFNGKSSYTIYVKNTGDYQLTVKAKTRLKTYKKTIIAPGKSVTLKLSDMKSSTEFYILFRGSEFSGYIE